MRSDHFISFLKALSVEKQIRLNGFCTLRLVRKTDLKKFKDSNFIESRYLPEDLVLAVRIAPTVGDYSGLIFETDADEADDDQPTTTTKTKSIKKVKILG
jgi:hypothetical protein